MTSADSQDPRKKRCLLLGVSGCAQAEVTPKLITKIQALDLGPAGLDIVVVATPSALKFFDVRSVEALIGRPLFVEHTDFTQEFDVPHIQLAQWAELVVVYPASANTIAKAAHGLTDTLLCNLILATRAPVYFAPIMNEAMSTHPITKDNLERLQRFGYHLVPKEMGKVFVHASKTWFEKEYCTEGAVLGVLKRVFV